MSNSIEHTNFILGTNTQQHDVHLMIKVKVTLRDDEGHRQRSNYYTNRHYACYQGTIQKVTSNDINDHALDIRTKSNVKVKDHRRGGVYVL